MGYLYTRDGGEHLKWWSMAFGSSVMRQIVGAVIVMAGAEQFLPILYGIVVAAGLFLMRGTYAFVGRRFSALWYLAGAICVAWSLGATFFEADFVVTTLPVFFFRGLTDIITGVTILRTERKAGALITAIAFILWGLHRWDYPFLRHVEWFAPWGFELAASLGVAVAVGMLTLHYERTREELLLKDESYRNLFENSIEGFIRTDAAGNILAANPAIVEILGYDSEEEIRLLQMGPDIYANPGDRARLVREYSAADFLDGVEVTWKRKDGSLRNVRLMARRFEVDGETQFEGSVQDITEQKALREQLEVARRMESLGRLAGGVAHDFNNILTAIIGGIELARLDAKDESVPVEELESIDIAARQGVDLARRLLAFSRQDVEVKTSHDVSEILANTEAMLSRLLPTTVELRIEVEDDLYVMTEPGQLERIIVNLAVNAEQAMPDGGDLEIRAVRDGEKVVFFITDTGVGMDESVVERIFEPFFTTKGIGEGTGLGLATTFKIIEALGGSIDVASEPGNGTKVTLTLAGAGPPSAPEPKDESQPITRAGDRVTVLFAEDDPQVRQNLVRYLERFDFDVIEAIDGEAALKEGLQHAGRIDVAVFDVVMPGMTGPEAAKKLLEELPSLPILFMSGYAAEELKEKGIDADQFLAKPFAPKELVAKIHALAPAASGE